MQPSGSNVVFFLQNLRLALLSSLPSLPKSGKSAKYSITGNEDWFLPLSLYQEYTLQRNVDLYIPRKGIARPHVSVSDLNIPTIGPPIFLQQNRQTYRGNNINHSQKHECIGIRTVVRSSFSGNICFEFWYCVFAVHTYTIHIHRSLAISYIQFSCACSTFFQCSSKRYFYT
jgi:hypothetical protein